MVDETAFRQVLRSTTPQPCLFGKALTAGCGACRHAEKHYLAEREAYACTDSAARAGCAALHHLLRHHSAFALKHIHEEDPLTHAQELKVQCGGVLGLKLALHGPHEIADLPALVAAARAEYGSLDELPYSQIMQSVSAVKVRQHRDGG
jgi:hypothetical protein